MGNKFGRSSFDRMIRSETYIGVFKWNDIRKENAVPPIITPELFYKCQARYNARNKKMWLAPRLFIFCPGNYAVDAAVEACVA